MRNCRTITLPSGRAVSLAAYIAAWRRVRSADPAQEFTGFDSFHPQRAQTAKDILRQLRAGMHERISEGIPYHLRGLVSPLPQRGRKWSSDWQRLARQCAYQANTPRLVLGWVPAEIRERLAHRLWEAE